MAAVFAVHPLRAESVAWVSERKDVLSGVFFMLTLGAYVSYVRHRFSLVRYGAVIVFFALGLMAKPMLVTLPLVLLLLDYWPLGRMTSAAAGDTSLPGGGWLRRFSSSRHLILEKLPLLSLAAAFVRGDAVGARQSVGSASFPSAFDTNRQRPGFLRRLPEPALLAVRTGRHYVHPGSDLPVSKVIVAMVLLLCISAGALAVGGGVRTFSWAGCGTWGCWCR